MSHCHHRCTHAQHDSLGSMLGFQRDWNAIVALGHRPRVVLNGWPPVAEDATSVDAINNWERFAERLISPPRTARHDCRSASCGCLAGCLAGLGCLAWLAWRAWLRRAAVLGQVHRELFDAVADREWRAEVRRQMDQWHHTPWQ